MASSASVRARHHVAISRGGGGGLADGRTERSPLRNDVIESLLWESRGQRVGGDLEREGEATLWVPKS